MNKSPGNGHCFEVFHSPGLTSGPSSSTNSRPFPNHFGVTDLPPHADAHPEKIHRSGIRDGIEHACSAILTKQRLPSVRQL